MHLWFFRRGHGHGGIGFQALLEAKGGRVVGLAAILIGVVPIMAGSIVASLSDRMMAIASWIIAISPVALPVYAPASLLTIAELPVNIARSVPRAFYFWLTLGLLTVLWLVGRLWASRRAMAQRILSSSVR